MLSEIMENQDGSSDQSDSDSEEQDPSRESLSDMLSGNALQSTVIKEDTPKAESIHNAFMGNDAFENKYPSKISHL